MSDSAASKAALITAANDAAQARMNAINDKLSSDQLAKLEKARHARKQRAPKSGATKSSDERVERLKKWLAAPGQVDKSAKFMFDKADLDKNGKLDITEASALIKDLYANSSLGVPSDAEFQQCWLLMDQNGDNMADFQGLTFAFVGSLFLADASSLACNFLRVEVLLGADVHGYCTRRISPCDKLRDWSTYRRAVVR